MRPRSRFLLVAVVACFPTLCAAAWPEASPAAAKARATSRTRTARPPGPAQRLLELINRDRAAARVPPVVLRSDLGDLAASFATRLAGEGALRHNQAFLAVESLQRLGVRKVGENVGFATSLESVHRLFMDSPPHRANILDPDFDGVGISVARGDGASLYVVEDFAAGSARKRGPARIRARSGTRPRVR